MRLLLDELHAPAVAEALRGRGIDAVAAAATVQLRGLADQDLLAFASADQRTLVTENVGDFTLLHGRWLAEGRAHAGIVFTSPKRFQRASLAYPGVLIEALTRFVQELPVQGDSWVWWLA